MGCCCCCCLCQRHFRGWEVAQEEEGPRGGGGRRTGGSRGRKPPLLVAPTGRGRQGWSGRRGSQRGAGPTGRGPRIQDRWQSRQDQLCACNPARPSRSPTLAGRGPRDEDGGELTPSGSISGGRQPRSLLSPRDDIASATAAA